MIQSKPEIPIFEQILVEKTDTAEIKKFIRKVNYDMIGYSCNHNGIDEKVNKVYKNVVNIYTTEEYIEYRNFINHTLIPLITTIIGYDKDGKIFNINHTNSIGTSGDNLLLGEYDEPDYCLGINFPSKADIDNITEDVITINGMIADNNSQTNKRCSRCEAAIRKYKYSVFEINLMREELREQQEINQQYVEQPMENKYDMQLFLQKNFPSMERFLLSDVKEKYRLTFNMNITKENLRKLIENTKTYKISNVHNVLYVNRL